VLVFVPFGLGQTEAATLSGLITDPQGRVVPDVAVDVTNVDTNVSVHQTTNNVGLYVVVGLKPGRYRVSVTKEGFRRIDLTDLVLNVQDVLSRNFQLQLGPVLASITVVADSLNVNTTDASVSTVIDRQFVERLPLNGRSINMLLQLTPGVVIAPSNNAAPGQFSIAGQRTDSNNFTVDGVSANFGVVSIPIPYATGTGSAQAFSAIGGTSSLVSVEALQEFRIETSSVAPEFGRAPGGQVILTTRSGTNDFHGGGYEYFRNDVMDANDWFANAVGKARAPERHNDFGGFFGGPIWRDKTFFFASYEGARLRLPETKVIQVPSKWARTVAAPAALVPFLDAYPQPDDQTITPNVYTSNFTGVWSDTATLNAGSIRIDHTFNPRFSIFGRYNDAPSSAVERINSLSMLNSTNVDTRTATVGFNAWVTSHILNTLRVNYSTQYSGLSFSLDSFGGALPPASNLLLGSLSSRDNTANVSIIPTAPYETGPFGRNKTKQFNLIDDFSFSIGAHQLKFGTDYRVIYLDANPVQALFTYRAANVQTFISSGGKVTISAGARAFAKLRSQSLSLYAQDTWRLSRRATLTYGLRWEVSPAPAALGTTTLASWSNVDDPSQLALAPSGTPVWSTRYGNVAPRVGLAYALTDRGDFVLRAGAGIFYDLGVGSVAGLVGVFPNLVSKFTPNVTIPVADLTPFVPAFSLQPPYPDGLTSGFSPNLTIPRSYQWNLSLEKSIGSKQVITATYVGQAGRDLLRQKALFQPNSNFSGDFLLSENDAKSNYNALQIQYRRPLSARLQALFNYTWSHSLDNASDDVVAGLSNTVISGASDYGSSDFDVRHSFSGALSFDVPAATGSRLLRVLTRDWSIDTVVVARSGFPFNAVVVLQSPDPSGSAFSRPDRVPGQPLWISAPTAPGGKMLNYDAGTNTGAFFVPLAPRQGTEGRNDIPGFGLTQVDLSVGRKFPITEKVNLQFRADAFNVLNHSNFTNPDGQIEFDVTDLQSTQMLNKGLHGLNSLFQEGGPRSLQLSLKLTF
jgi:hypothetical protein